MRVMAQAQAKQPRPRTPKREMRVRRVTLIFQSIGTGMKTANIKSVMMLREKFVYDNANRVLGAQHVAFVE